MNPLSFGTVISLWAAVALSPCSASPQELTNGRGDVEVRGKELFRDGRPWLPHGYYQIAFEVAPANLARVDHQFWRTAQELFSAQEYTEMRRAGADTVRIQISQAGADPQSPIFDANFLNNAIHAVRTARDVGLTVIICVQGESHVPGARNLDLPGPGTRRVWTQIAPLFATDHGVMFELLNEPVPQANPQNWSLWKSAMTETLQTVRGTGASNVVIADGLGTGQVLEGAPLLGDPQVAYASHPYALQQHGQTREAWDEKFGAFARHAPVIITEWHFGGYFCNAKTPVATVEFLHYLQDHRIGVVVGTWDWAPAGFGNARWGFPDGKFSTFAGRSCHEPGYGLGRTIESWYKTGRLPDLPE